MRVSVNGGKYEYVLHEDGRSEVLRYGERCRDSVGDKFTYCMAAEIDQLRKQRDELLAALESISNITGDAGFNIGGPIEHCPGVLDHNESKMLLILACEYIKDISKASSNAIDAAKCGAA